MSMYIYRLFPFVVPPFYEPKTTLFFLAFLFKDVLLSNLIIFWGGVFFSVSLLCFHYMNWKNMQTNMVLRACLVPGDASKTTGTSALLT